MSIHALRKGPAFAVIGALLLSSCDLSIKTVRTEGRMESSIYTISVVSGSGQSGTVATALGSAFIVEIKDSEGQTVSGIRVDWTTSTGGSLSSPFNDSDVLGRSSSTLTLATLAGLNSITATIHGTSSSVSFAATGNPGPITQFAFTRQPSNSVAGSAISPAIEVKARDVYGNEIPGYSSPNLTMSITAGANPGSSTLSGTTTQSPVAGMTSFNDLSLNKTGTGYKLTVTNGTITADSATFNVTAGAASQLVFTQQPSNSGTGALIAPAIAVEARDANGNVVTGFAANVVMSITSGANPGSSTLSGTATRAPSSGVATFNDLSLNNGGTGYQLTATAGSLTVDSSAFNILGATFNGWTHVKALGPKVPHAISPDMATEAATATIVWSAVTMTSGSVDSYNVYRSTAAASQTFATPLATGISASARSYTDTAVVAGTTYYYNIAPVQSGSVFVPAAAADREIKVIVPTDNMALMHRWIANKDMCETMGKAVDRNNHYRCAFTGIGGDGTYFDFGKSVFIDRFEQGYNITVGAGKCTAGGTCIGTNGSNLTQTPAVGDVYYARFDQSVNRYNGSTWENAEALPVGAAFTAIFTNQPGTAPAVTAGEIRADAVCKSQTVPGFAGTKRMLRRKEFVEASAWDASLSDAQINTIEDGVNLDTTHNCNSNYASPQGDSGTVITGSLAYDNTDYPAAANRDTLPACRIATSADCTTGGVTFTDRRAVRTGSAATSNCVSRYGIQDLVGNVAEYTADQMSDAGGIHGVISAIDAVADLVGFLFDDLRGPSVAFDDPLSTWGYIEFPHAFPIVDPLAAGPGTLDWTATPAKFHGDSVNIMEVCDGVPGCETRSRWSGGTYEYGPKAGRFFLQLRTTNPGGFRCAFDAD